MGLLARIEQRASKGGQFFLSNPDAFALQLMGASDVTASGIKVDPETALEWSPLAAAIRVLCNTTAMIPLQVLQSDAEGNKTQRRDIPLWDVLHGSPNPEQTAMEMRCLIPTHQILWGDFFAEIIRANGQVRQLWPLNPDRVKVDRRGRSLVYIITTKDGPRKLLKHQVLHIPGFSSGGLVGRSLVKDHAETIGLGLATERYTAHFFGNDATPGGYLQHPETLSDEAFKHIQGTWNAAHQGLNQSHRMAILEEGMEWQQVMSDPEKADALGLKKFQVNEAIRIVTGVPPHLIGDLERSTFSNVEESTRNFTNYGVQPTCTKIEQRMNMSLLTEGERDQNIFVQHQLQGLLRGSVEAREGFYNTMLNLGVFNINDVRKLENLNSIGPDGDTHFIRMDMQTLDRAINQPAEPIRTERTAEVLDRRQNALRLQPAIYETRIARDTVRTDFLLVFRDVMKRLMTSELDRVRGALKILESGDVAAFREFLRSYYFEEFPPRIRKIVGPLFLAYADAMARAAAPEVDADPTEQDVTEFTDDYIEKFANRHSRSSRTQIEKILESPDEDSVGLIDQRLNDWEEGAEGEPRYIRMAEREGRQLGNLTARDVFITAGALFMVSRAIGDSCPFCLKLDGKRVSFQTPFLRADEQFQPEGASSPLVPRTNMFAPPYHTGCDCIIEPS